MRNILLDLAVEITKIDPNQKTGRIVKDIDKLFYRYCEKMYRLNDTKTINKVENVKSGHCC